MKKAIHFSIPNLKSSNFFTTILVVLVITLFVILMGEMPDHGRSLIGKWYFTGTVWLICLAGLAKRYMEENENVQQKNRGDKV